MQMKDQNTREEGEPAEWTRNNQDGVKIQGTIDPGTCQVPTQVQEQLDI